MDDSRPVINAWYVYYELVVVEEQVRNQFEVRELVRPRQEDDYFRYQLVQTVTYLRNQVMQMILIRMVLSTKDLSPSLLIWLPLSSGCM